MSQRTSISSNAHPSRLRLLSWLNGLMLLWWATKLYRKEDIDSCISDTKLGVLQTYHRILKYDEVARTVLPKLSRCLLEPLNVALSAFRFVEIESSIRTSLLTAERRE